MDSIKLFACDSKERENLSKAAAILTAISPNKVKYSVIETYFDFGQDWKWTTLLAVRPDGAEYQALSPLFHEMIVSSDDILNTINTVVNHKYWNDK